MSKSRTRVATVGVALSALVLAGCGGDEESSATEALAECETTKEATIVLGTPDLDVSYLPYGLLADELGYFAGECLDITVEASGSALPSLLSTGKADFLTMTPETITMASDSEPMGISFVHNFMPSLNIFLAVPEDSPIKDPGDLKGATIGVSNANPLYDAFITESFKEYGLTLDDVDQIETSYGVTPMKALETGEVDAILYWPGILTSWEQAGYHLRWLEADWSEAYDGFGLVAATTTVEKDPELIEGVSRALAKSAVYLQRYPESAVRIFWEMFPERAPLPGGDEDEKLAEDLAILDSTLVSMKADEYPEDHTWGIQTLERWTGQVAYAKEGGLITGDPDPTQFFYADHIEAANDFDRADIEEVKK
ncbi:ABC transporter substrate-binding protein [Nocardioides sp. cx-169]|uniref:ABC transporter substrate-binding protein n=1 Tax=Nocardioides sp. cx-169 TaxID=2899080 RepID=UPI001E4DB508|nr:ABC transporter substrate-binding protein [Nocardioides sp. cx-169]MCD4532904.1 ABC transporter substrate-binding protein [Nocardioides sp. cx-169]